LGRTVEPVIIAVVGEPCGHRIGVADHPSRGDGEQFHRRAAKSSDLTECHPFADDVAVVDPVEAATAASGGRPRATISGWSRSTRPMV